MRRMRNSQQAVERLREECRREGLDISGAAAQNILADLVTTPADLLAIREETVVRPHLSTVSVADLVAHVKQADDAQNSEVAAASLAVVGLENAGRVIASLAQAVRCVGLNHDRLAEGRRDKWEAVGVFDDASNCLTLLAKPSVTVTPQPEAPSYSGATQASYTHGAPLTQTIANLRDGGWTFAHGRQLGADVVTRMSADLETLPPQ